MVKRGNKLKLQLQDGEQEVNTGHCLHWLVPCCNLRMESGASRRSRPNRKWVSNRAEQESKLLLYCVGLQTSRNKKKKWERQHRFTQSADVKVAEVVGTEG